MPQQLLTKAFPRIGVQLYVPLLDLTLLSRRGNTRHEPRKNAICIGQWSNHSEIAEDDGKQDIRREHCNTKNIASEWDRVGRFYASLEHGHATASVALKRLVAYSSTNQFYKANRDLGRVFKTEFILQYMSQPQLRRRIRRGTLKVEELHALARDVFYAKRGRISVREIQDQMNSCSCLTLILACIIYWQASEISRHAPASNSWAAY